MIFRQRGMHSKGLRNYETTSSSLCSRSLPHSPAKRGGVSRTRSIGRFSGSGRRGDHGICGLLFGGFQRCEVGLGILLRPGLFKISDASSSCSTSSLPHSEGYPNRSRGDLTGISFSRSISSRAAVTSLFTSISCSRCAMILTKIVARQTRRRPPNLTLEVAASMRNLSNHKLSTERGTRLRSRACHSTGHAAHRTVQHVFEGQEFGRAHALPFLTIGITRRPLIASR